MAQGDYEEFEDWCEDEIKIKFDNIKTKDDFVKRVDKIRQKCYETPQGRHIFKTYFDGTSVAREVDEENLTFRTGVRAEKAWTKLIEQETEVTYQDELKKIASARDAAKIAEEIIKSDRWDRPSTKRKLMDFLREQEAYKDLPADEKKRIDIRQAMVDYTDMQQGEGAYKKIKSKEIKDELQKTREDLLRRFPELTAEPVMKPLGQKLIALTRPSDYYHLKPSDFFSYNDYRRDKQRFIRNVWPGLKADISRSHGFENTQDLRKTEGLLKEYRTEYSRTVKAVSPDKRFTVEKLFAPKMLKEITNMAEYNEKLRTMKDYTKPKPKHEFR